MAENHAPKDGPLEECLRRLTECPEDFLALPRQGSGGVIHVDAVVSDLLRDLGLEPLQKKECAPFCLKGANHRPHLRHVLVACWLLHHEWFRQCTFNRKALLRFLDKDLAELARLVPTEQLVADPDRREELVRSTFKALGLRPAGETKAQAQDRLRALDSVERDRVIRETRAQQEHARKVREAMERKRAQEAAARYSRE